MRVDAYDPIRRELERRAVFRDMRNQILVESRFENVWYSRERGGASGVHGKKHIPHPVNDAGRDIKQGVRHRAILVPLHTSSGVTAFEISIDVCGRFFKKVGTQLRCPQLRPAPQQTRPCCGYPSYKPQNSTIQSVFQLDAKRSGRPDRVASFSSSLHAVWGRSGDGGRGTAYVSPALFGAVAQPQSGTWP
jgi:hypothetical protein